MKAGESDIVLWLLNALKDAPSAASIQPPERIYAVQEASSALSALVDETIEGTPQVIQNLAMHVAS